MADHGASSPPTAQALPDGVWQTVFGHFTENRDFFGCALVCRRWADIVRNSKTLESIGFVWDKTPSFSSTRRAELFLDWLGTRIGKKTLELELALVPEAPSVVSQGFKNNMWCIIGQMSGSLKHLAIKANAGLVTDVGPWVSSFTGLEYLLLAPRGNSLAVRTSLVGLSKLKDFILSVKQTDYLDNMEDGLALQGAQAQNLMLEFPPDRPAWLPPGLTALRLECPTLSALPDCLSTLSALATLEINTRTPLTNSSLILQQTGVRGLELTGCVPEAFVAQLSAFEQLTSLTLTHLPLGGATGGETLTKGLSALKMLKSLSLSYCHLAAFPSVVTSLPGLAFLDISFNPDVAAFPDGPHLRQLELLAVDWAAVAADPSGLQSAEGLAELCLTDRPPTSEAVARVLDAMADLEQLCAVYFDVGQGTQMTHAVVEALAVLARTRTTLQFKSLEDCLW